MRDYPRAKYHPVEGFRVKYAEEVGRGRERDRQGKGEVS